MSNQYRDTKIKDFYLDVWTSITMPSSINDDEITISSKYHQRPDLLSYQLYGSANYWWVFALRNKDILIDPIADFKSGTKIFVVSKSTVESL